MNRISYTKPSMTQLEVSYATDAAQNGWGEKCYEYINKFEAALSAYIGSKYVIATSSCTGALHMGLAALGVGQGDEVIVADTNWIASVAPITYLGATPVFVDILPKSWCLDPILVERAITPRTKAILAVHLYGNLCELDRLLDIGRRFNIPVVEDAAEAIGSYWHGRHAGSMGRFGVFSFHGTKTVSTGEGGAFVTDDKALFDNVLTLSNHGRAAGQPRQFWPEHIGYKYKMANIQAAIGCGQLERIDTLVAAKRRIFAFYQRQLAHIAGIEMNVMPANTESGYWMPTVVMAPELRITREDLLTAYRAANIDARVFFHPLSSLPMFSPKPENRNSYDIPTRAINLPSYHDLTEADQQRVVDVVVELVQTRSGHNKKSS